MPFADVTNIAPRQSGTITKMAWKQSVHKRAGRILAATSTAKRVYLAEKVKADRQEALELLEGKRRRPAPEFSFEEFLRVMEERAEELTEEEFEDIDWA